MEKSIVYMQMGDDNYHCSYAVVDKILKSVVIILKDLECVIYDYDDFIKDDFDYKFLLLKHYDNPRKAYKDFMKLIGKMCKKDIESKYFKNHISEENRIIFEDDEKEVMISNPDKVYLEREQNLIDFIQNNKEKFIINKNN